jgi:hypothetical protein
MEMKNQTRIRNTMDFGVIVGPWISVVLFLILAPKYVLILILPDDRYQPMGWILAGILAAYYPALFCLSRKTTNIIVKYYHHQQKKSENIRQSISFCSFAAWCRASTYYFLGTGGIDGCDAPPWDNIVPLENEQPRGIKDRIPQELRSLPRFPHLLSKEEAGQALHSVIETPWEQVRGNHHAEAG